MYLHVYYVYFNINYIEILMKKIPKFYILEYYDYNSIYYYIIIINIYLFQKSLTQKEIGVNM